jgi:hypothetical protein
MRRVFLALWCVITALACGKSSGVAVAPVPTAPSEAVTVPAVTIFASITIAGPAAVTTAIAGPTGILLGQSVSFTFSIKTDASDSVRDVLVDWGDGETADLGAVSQGVASHSFSTAGTFVLTAKVDTSAGRHPTVSVALTVGR